MILNKKDIFHLEEILIFLKSLQNTYDIITGYKLLFNYNSLYPHYLKILEERENLINTYLQQHNQDEIEESDIKELNKQIEVIGLQEYPENIPLYKINSIYLSDLKLNLIDLEKIIPILDFGQNLNNELL